jgi:GntR family transcriptional repressor for pyruvate dehydrogenase complex
MAGMTAEAFLPNRIELELPNAATTAELVSDYLRRVVHRGELGPGDRLPAERQLAVALGVGRVTLREALLGLENAGYILRRRGVTGGAFVTDLVRPFAAWRTRVLGDAAGLQELWDLREAVEVQIVRLAAARRTKADVAALEAADQQLRETTTRADFRRADLQFHGHLATAAQSPRLAALMYATRGELFSPIEPHIVASRVRRAADDHSDVTEALRLRDPDGAERAIREHLRTARAELRKALAVKLS